MKQPPAVSIITPTKNRLPLLRDTMDSVAAQTRGDWEHIVVDDGSEDGTQAELAHRSRVDDRVRFVQRPGERAGANVCRNIGLRESRADLIVFLDSDDLLAPDCLARRVDVMRRNADLDFCVWQSFVFNKRIGDLNRQLNYDILGDDLLKFLCMEMPWIITGPTWRTDALRKLGGFDEDIPSWQDIELHVRAIAGGLRYVRFPDADHHIRWNDWDPLKTSVVQHRSPEHLEAAMVVFDRMEAAVRRGPGLDWSRQRALCSLYFSVAGRWVRAGHWPAGWKTWRAARVRGLLPSGVFAAGAAFLGMQRVAGESETVRRLTNKWIGFARMRTNAELVGS